MEQQKPGKSRDNRRQRNTKPKNNNKISKDHIHRKREPTKPERGENVVYVNTKSPINALLERCNKLLAKNVNEIILYCLGAAIQRGILLATKFCEQHPLFQLHANTFTTEVLDDLEPITCDADFETNRRLNSALKIKLFRKISPEQQLDTTTSSTVPTSQQ